MLKARQDEALRNLIWWKVFLPTAGGLDLDDLQGFFQHKLFWDSMKNISINYPSIYLLSYGKVHQKGPTVLSRARSTSCLCVFKKMLQSCFLSYQSWFTMRDHGLEYGWTKPSCGQQIPPPIRLMFLFCQIPHPPAAVLLLIYRWNSWKITTQ